MIPGSAFTNSLNRIVLLVQNIVAGHQMKPSFAFGTIPDFNAYNETFFPAIFMEPSSSTEINSIQGVRVEKLTFNLYCLDRIDRALTLEGDNKQEIWSDTKYILQTIVGFIRESQYGRDNFLILDSSDLQFTPVVRATDENCNGWMIKLSFRVPIVYNPCNSPIALGDQIILNGATAGSLSGIGSYRTQLGGSLKFQYDLVTGNNWNESSNTFGPYPSGNNNINVFDPDIHLSNAVYKVRLRNINNNLPSFIQAYSNEIIINNFVPSESIFLHVPIIDCFENYGWFFSSAFDVQNGSGNYALQSFNGSTFSTFLNITGTTDGTVSGGFTVSNIGGPFPVGIPIRVKDGSYVSNTQLATFSACSFIFFSSIDIECSGSDVVANLVGASGQQDIDYILEVYISGNWESLNDIGWVDVQNGNWSQTVNLSDTTVIDITDYMGQELNWRISNTSGATSASLSATVSTCFQPSSVSINQICYTVGNPSGTIQATYVNAYGYTGSSAVLFESFDNTNFTEVQEFLLDPIPYDASGAIFSLDPISNLFYYKLGIRDSNGDIVYTDSVRFINTVVTIDQIYYNVDTLEYDLTVVFINAYHEPTAGSPYVVLEESNDGINFGEFSTLQMDSDPFTGTKTFSGLPFTPGLYYRIAFTGECSTGSPADDLHSNIYVLPEPSQIIFNNLCTIFAPTASGSADLINMYADQFTGEFEVQESIDNVSYHSFSTITAQTQPWTINGLSFDTPPVTDTYYYRIVGKNIAQQDIISNEIQYITTFVNIDSIDQVGSSYSINVTYANACSSEPPDDIITLQYSADGMDPWVAFFRALGHLPFIPYDGTASYIKTLTTLAYYRIVITDPCGVFVYSEPYYLDNPSNIHLISLTHSNTTTVAFYATASNIYEYHPTGLDVRVQVSDDNMNWTNRANINGVLGSNPYTGVISFTNTDTPYTIGKYLRIYGTDYHGNYIYSNGLQIT